VSSLSTSGSETTSNLEGIVDNPLEAGKGTNHENSGSKTLPESIESDLGVDLLNLSSGRCTSLVLFLVEDGDHGISWVRDESAENTSNISGHESDHELGSLGVFTLWLGEDFAVECGNDLLESDELNNSVWDLSSPEWLETLVETIHTFSFLDDAESLHGTLWESSSIRCLHSNLKLYIKKVY